MRVCHEGSKGKLRKSPEFLLSSSPSICFSCIVFHSNNLFAPTRTHIFFCHAQLLPPPTSSFPNQPPSSPSTHISTAFHFLLSKSIILHLNTLKPPSSPWRPSNSDHHHHHHRCRFILLLKKLWLRE